MNDSRYQSEVLEMPPKLSFETRDMDNLPKMAPKMVMEELPKMAPMEKMIIPRLDPGMPDGYYTEQTIRPYIQNPIVYDNMRYFEGLQHRAHGNTQTSPPVSTTNVSALRAKFHNQGGGKRARKSRKSRKVRKFRKVRKSRKARKSRRRARR